MNLKEAKEAHILAVVDFSIAKIKAAEARNASMLASSKLSEAERKHHTSLRDLEEVLLRLKPSDIEPPVRVRTAHEARKS